MAKTLKTIGDSPSKQEEIDFLTAIAGAVPENSYLKQLFSEDFILWAVTSIRDDAALDLYEDWQKEMRSARALNDNLVRLSDENKVFRESADLMRQQIIDFQTTVTTMREAVNEIACERDNALAHLDTEKAYRADENKLRHEYLDEMNVMKKMLIAVVDDTSDEDMKIAARMLVFGWKR